jgi:hypothetical protein
MTTKPEWLFDIDCDAVVVTTSYVTDRRFPILYVSHEDDGEGGATWQFHCDNGDFSGEVLRLVRLDEILQLDSGLQRVAGLPVGYCARRASADSEWVIEKEDANDTSSQ